METIDLAHSELSTLEIFACEHPRDFEEGIWNPLDIMSQLFQESKSLRMLTTLGLSLDVVDCSVMVAIGSLFGLERLTLRCPASDLDPERDPRFLELGGIPHNYDRPFNALRQLLIYDIAPQPLSALLGFPGLTTSLTLARFYMGRADDGDQFLPLAFQRLAQSEAKTLSTLTFVYPSCERPYDLPIHCLRLLRDLPLEQICFHNVWVENNSGFSAFRSLWPNVTHLRWRHQPALLEDLSVFATERPHLKVLAVSLHPRRGARFCGPGRLSSHPVSGLIAITATGKRLCTG